MISGTQESRSWQGISCTIACYCECRPQWWQGQWGWQSLHWDWIIPHPTRNFNIQDAMGLSGSEKRQNKCSSILVCFLLQCSLPFLNVFCYSKWLENLLGMCDLIGSWSIRKNHLDLEHWELYTASHSSGGLQLEYRYFFAFVVKQPILCL